MVGRDFNSESFDLDDLWRHTDALVPGLRDEVYIAEYWDDVIQVGVNLAWSRREEQPVIWLEEAALPGTGKENTALMHQIYDAMGDPCHIPRFDRIQTTDGAPSRSRLPEVQLDLAQRFLPGFQRIVLDGVVIFGDDETQPLSVGRRGVASRANVLQLARINLGIATILGCEIAEYQEIVELAKEWDPHSMRPFKWM